jgi:putative glutamine amidotransferase
MTPRAGFTFGKKNPAWPKKIEPYLDALRYAGLEPVLLLPGDDHRGLAAFVIGGGTDIDPARYGDERAPETEDPDGPRDELELAVLKTALAEDLPLLAICRGLQMFQVIHGGKLTQHIDGHTQPGVHDAHAVTVMTDSRLHAITKTQQFAVNSRHHQAAVAPPAVLRVAARAADGTIEALERHDRRFAVAVQWHPEDRVRTHPADRALFEAFSAACR